MSNSYDVYMCRIDRNPPVIVINTRALYVFDGASKSVIDLLNRRQQQAIHDGFMMVEAKKKARKAKFSLGFLVLLFIFAAGFMQTFSH